MPTSTNSTHTCSFVGINELSFALTPPRFVSQVALSYSTIWLLRITSGSLLQLVGDARASSVSSSCGHEATSVNFKARTRHYEALEAHASTGAHLGLGGRRVWRLHKLPQRFLRAEPIHVDRKNSESAVKFRERFQTEIYE